MCLRGPTFQCHRQSSIILSSVSAVFASFCMPPSCDNIAAMGSRTTSRPTKKRASPAAAGDDETSPLKRHRSEAATSGKENNGVDSPARSAKASASASATETDESILGNRHMNPPGKPAEAGVIKKIYVENFMCHRKFTLDLCRNVNFIYGQNGSGKSAILAAIQICLGAGAKRTHRARNLKELVRKDSKCAAAKIQVTLLNRGDDGYLHDVYGDSITVERTIAIRGGYNGYKLLDDDMNEVSRNKKDLDEMLDKLNIQVENPVALLDQEEAKKFLTGKAEDKYNFFMKATELERIDRTYASSLDLVEDLHTQSERLRGNLGTYIAQAEDAEKRWKETQIIDKMEKKCNLYEEMYAWARHKEAEEVLTLKKEVSTTYLEWTDLMSTSNLNPLNLSSLYRNAIDFTKRRKRKWKS